MYIGKLWLENDFYGDDYFVSGEEFLFSGFKIAGSDIFFTHIWTYANAINVCIPVADFI